MVLLPGTYFGFLLDADLQNAFSKDNCHECTTIMLCYACTSVFFTFYLKLVYKKIKEILQDLLRLLRSR